MLSGAFAIIGLYSYVNNNPLTRIDPTGFDDNGIGILPDLYSYGSRIFDDAGNGLGAIGNAFKNAWDWLTGSGGSKLDANDAAGKAHGINIAQSIQGAPSSDGTFHYAMDAPSGTQGPQATAASANQLPEQAVTGVRPAAVTYESNGTSLNRCWYDSRYVPGFSCLCARSGPKIAFMLSKVNAPASA